MLPKSFLFDLCRFPRYKNEKEQKNEQKRNRKLQKPRKSASSQKGTVVQAMAWPCISPRNTRSTSQPKIGQQKSTKQRSTVVPPMARPCSAKDKLQKLREPTRLLSVHTLSGQLDKHGRATHGTPVLPIISQRLVRRNDGNLTKDKGYAGGTVVPPLARPCTPGLAPAYK